MYAFGCILIYHSNLDATFVDVIHTDARSFFLLEIPGYGMSQAVGHIDFYPNNGKEQPGCALSQEGGTLIPLTLIKDGIEEASRVLLACNHVRAIKLFIDSINGKCPYVGMYRDLSQMSMLPATKSEEKFNCPIY